MVKRKGLSADEKRDRILKIFHEKKEVFQLKEVEKIASTEKGVVLQAVKEVLKELVDDNLVDSDKIGTSVYFWAFPGKLSQHRLARLAELREKSKRLHAAHTEVLRKLEEKQAANDEEGDSTDLVSRLEELRKTNKSLEERHRKLAENNPEIVNKLKEEVRNHAAELNKWTDNLFNVRSWVKKKFGKTEQEVNRIFNIPQELDYID